MVANITNIKKFAVHDGDGIRTTVFFKGCPIRCVWCHNPENISAKSELAFYAHKCAVCRKCMAECENHKITDGKHIIDREKCIACGKCVNVCPNEALVLYGRKVLCEEICDILLEDKDFYEASGGGITLSGGECLLQPDACREILVKMKEKGIHTAVDTCGAIPFENIEKVIDYTDVFLYDLKAIDEDVHVKCTGKTNEYVLQNLKKIDDYGKKIEIRIPYVPDYNDGQMDKILEVVQGLKNLDKVRVLAYHDFARSKYMALDIPDTMPQKLPDKKKLETLKEKLKACKIKCVD